MNPVNGDKRRSLLSRYLIGDEDDDDDDGTGDDDEERTKNPLNSDDDAGRLVIDFNSDSNRSTTLSNRSYHSRLPASKSCDFYNEQVKVQRSEANKRPATSSTKASVAWLDDTIVPLGSNSSPKRSQYRIAFEIIRAKIISGSSGSEETRPPTTTLTPFSESRYVLYTILIKRVPGLETHPAVIDRRYSDFHLFYTSLARRFKHLLAGISLPKKQLLGNFSPEVISRRSEQFQNILVYCYSNPELRASKEFAEFLYYPELREASRLLKTIMLEEAGAIFENVFFILDKIRAFPAQCLHTLACLIGCLNAVDNQNEAQKFAQQAFDLLDELDSSHGIAVDANSTNNLQIVDIMLASELILPMILLALRQNWFIGDRKRSLEIRRDRFCGARSLPKAFESHPTLLECLLKKDFNPILE